MLLVCLLVTLECISGKPTPSLVRVWGGGGYSVALYEPLTCRLVFYFQSGCKRYNLESE